MGGWHDLAACRGVALSVFFPPEIDAGDSWAAHGWNDTEAKTLCAGCPVSQWCLAWALDHNIHAGIFGGLNLGSRTDRRLIPTGDDRPGLCRHCGGLFHGNRVYCDDTCRAAAVTRQKRASRERQRLAS